MTNFILITVHGLYFAMWCTSPGQFFSHCVIRTRDKSSRVCARTVCLRCHGKCSQTDSPQQLEHKHAQEHRLKEQKQRRNDTKRHRKMLKTQKTKHLYRRVRGVLGDPFKNDSPQATLVIVHLEMSLHGSVQCASPAAAPHSIHVIITAAKFV